MFYLFLIVLMLAPIPACYLLYKLFKKHHNTFSASLLFNMIKFDSSGVAAAYVSILLMLITFTFPESLGVKKLNISQAWKYHLNIHRTCNAAQNNHAVNCNEKLNMSGKFYFTRKAGEVFSVWNKQGNFLIPESKYGLTNKRNIFFQIPIDLDSIKYEPHPTLIAIGKYNHSKMLLKVYSLTNGNVNHKFYWQGKLELTHSWPFFTLIFISTLPLVILFLLSKIGPLIMNLVVNTFFTPQKSGHHLFSFSVILSGSIAGYIAFAFIIFMMLNNGLPIFNKRFIESAVQSCKRIQGVWNYDIVIDKKFLNKKNPIAKGIMKVECTDDLAAVKINGVHFPNYESPNLNKKHRNHWNLFLSGFINHRLIGVYKTDSVVSSAGLLTGIIGGVRDHFSLNFYDFNTYPNSPNYSLSGRLILYPQKQFGYK